jgi:hypothetical protein
MRGMTVFGAALAALLLCSFAVVAPWAGGPSGEMHDGSIDEAAHLQEELRVGAAELAAVPAESRAVVAKVLGRLGALRGELQELRRARRGRTRGSPSWRRASAGAAEARAESLSARVAKLEENNCEEHDELEEVPEADELDDYSQLPLNSARRRVQAPQQACTRVRDFQALSAAAMDACCLSNGGGHRRLQASCDLPLACPSAACVAVFVPYMQDCVAMLVATPGVPVADFESFAASCAEMQAGAGEMLQPVAVRMFRVLANMEGAAQAGGMFPGGGGSAGAGGNLDPLQPLPPAPPPPPPPPPDAGSGDATTGVTQYHAVGRTRARAWWAQPPQARQSSCCPASSSCSLAARRPWLLKVVGGLIGGRCALLCSELCAMSYHAMSARLSLSLSVCVCVADARLYKDCCCR